MAKIEVPDELIPENARLIEAYETAKEVIVIGEPEWIEGHNCDEMGCATLSHVICRITKAVASLCTECGKDEAEWPIENKNLCQMCWEAYCSELWWAMVDGYAKNLGRKEDD